MTSPLIDRQFDLHKNLNKILTNFKKDPKSRKNPEYIRIRLETLENLWQEFTINHDTILQQPDRSSIYFVDELYRKATDLYHNTKTLLTSYGKEEDANVSHSSQELDSFLSLQRTYFRALNRKINNMDLESISEIWQIEDCLQNLKATWSTIEDLHIKIDNILEGVDNNYEDEFCEYEKIYNSIKLQLNMKLINTEHRYKATPQLEVPVFTGGFTQWPTFFDLFTETIHNNNAIAKAQKLQHLKNRVKGEPFRLIAHLNITADNYETAWDILTHRYQNHQAIFEQQIEIFLNQPSITKRSAKELKRLYDTTTECLHAIHNQHIDTKSWDPFLVHLLCKKLDPLTRSEYKESRNVPRELASIEEFMMFLERKFNSLEDTYYQDNIQKSLSNNFNKNQRFPYKSRNFLPYKSTQSGPQQQHRALFSTPYNQDNKSYQALATYVSPCLLCNQHHQLFQCNTFISMSPETQLRALTDLQVCANCLYKHYGRECISTKRCKECNGRHNSILHKAFMPTNSNAIFTTHKSIKHQQKNPQESKPTLPMSTYQTKNTYHVSSGEQESLLATALVNIQAADGTFVTFRALCDPASQVSLISERVVQCLGLKRERPSLSISGIDLCTKQSKGMVNINCQSLFDPTYQFEAAAYIMSKVVRDLPNTSFQLGSWNYLEQLQLADPDFNISRRIDILFGIDVYSRIIKNGLIKGPEGAPIAQNTSLGWIISGNIQTLHCHAVVREAVDLSKFWEVEDIYNNISTISDEDSYCESFYQETTRRLINGKYEVAYPMKPGYQNQLGTSKEKAVAQFKQLERKFSKNKIFSDSYKQFMQEYLDLGHMRLAKSSLNHSYYLPHHGVLKLDSETTKLRVVYNGSSKTSSGNSLNDLMYSGPNLQKDLQALILVWRSYKYVITADIEKMFRQTFVRRIDQPLQTIVWRNSPDRILQEYQLTTVTYGLKASNFLAIRTLKQLARDEAANYPKAAEAIESSFYTDDLLTGENSIEAIQQLINELISIFKTADTNLRKWSSNISDIILKGLSPNQLSCGTFEFKCQESRKTLGLKWNPNTDSFTFKNYFDQVGKNEILTKRQLLSNISKIFDPLGWLSPLSIRAKLIFQSTWLSATTWDDKIPIETQSKWNQLSNDFKDLENIKISRYLGQTSERNTLHAFCDASETSYACAIYLITKDYKGEYTSTLVTAKTKLAPFTKKLSLPRLELCGALLLSQLLKKVLDAFSKLNFDIYAWTDSMIILGWLYGDCERWKPFVANRVQQILNIIPASRWHHVKSGENPADCATRGLSKQKLSEYILWWQGPRWLLSFDPKRYENHTYQTPDTEVKKSACVHSTLKDNRITLVSELLNHYNSLSRATKVLGWVFRFINCARDKLNINKINYLSMKEMERASNFIIKQTQETEFSAELNSIKKDGQVSSKSKIIGLNPFIDNQGILRVRGRLSYSDLSDSAKYPIILSSHSRLTQLVIQQAHITTLHGGPRLTLSYIRNRFWIIRGIRTVKCQLRQCVKCRRFSNQTRHHIMGDLPAPRVTPSRPFTHTGVDFSGFVDLKINKGRGVRTCKGYIALFVCLATKATHLELVSDLSTQTFLAAFKRFCARRGVPRHMYSDNGTNFIGADRLLRKEYQEITRNINTEFFNNINAFQIEWSFNAPLWPSAGGLWEAAIKSMKYHLKRVLGSQKLTYEELTTLLYQVEACLNSRPLCQLTESLDDDFLTPGHFLIGGPLLSRPQTEPTSTTLSKRWELIQNMNKHIWKRWSTEYLQQLQIRSKWRTQNKNLQIDDVVLIKEDYLPPGKWALARVHELHPGKDGFVRVVTLKTSNTMLKRPVCKLVPLPVKEERSSEQCVKNKSTPSPSSTSSYQSNVNQNKPTLRTRRSKLLANLLLTALLLFTVCPSPSYQTTQNTDFNISSLTNTNRGLFFDKISDLNYIKDDWKLIVYYNMSTYWEGVSHIKSYIQNIRNTSKQSIQHYSNLFTQLEHEIRELDHFNRILINDPQTNRRKRGLVNGVGYLANTLFGVLDERFANQYKDDIEKITHNQNHLQNLIKNQTSVMETEYNILKRHEDIMKRQFTLINETIKNTSLSLQRVVLNTDNALSLLSSVMSANIVISNLRRMQQNLIDTITDISHGHIDPHLILPEELQDQFNIISSQLQGDLALPVDSNNIRDLYKLLKVSARIVTHYLIIEIKIPLLSTDSFELNKIIPLPQKRGSETLIIIPAFSYLAYNLNKDLAFLLSENDLRMCLQTSETSNILCSLNMPLYQLKLKQSLCDIKLLSFGGGTSTCDTLKTPCKDMWVKLHGSNDWLFTCCKECHVRIYCPSRMTIKNLQGSGIINIGQGCTLRADSFTLYGHNNYLSQINIVSSVEVPEVSILNTLINTSIPERPSEFKGHDEVKVWSELKSQIDDIKRQSSSDLSVHDIHHYSVLYGIIAIILFVGVCVGISKGRSRWRRRPERNSASAGQPPARDRVEHKVEMVNVSNVSEPIYSEVKTTKKPVKVSVKNMGTSPLSNHHIIL